ncbi:MAG: hypothetical protein GQ583_04835 [Methyloprofundus sp.]|nr:hypothetical protein [Methyloprofundus sp.]
MIQALKSEFKRQIEILKRKSTVAKNKFHEVKSEMERLENKISEKEAQVSIASKHDMTRRDTFIINGDPICPACLATKNIQNFLTPSTGTDEVEIYKCKSCAYKLETEI